MDTSIARTEPAQRPTANRPVYHRTRVERREPSAGEDHVKMAIGRDYADVPPTRGTSRGEGRDRLKVQVHVERLA